VVEAGPTEIVVVVGAWATVNGALPSEPVNVPSPEYVPVTVSLPAGAVEATQLPEPDTRGAVVHRVVPPIVKATEPVGVPPPLTVAE